MLMEEKQGEDDKGSEDHKETGRLNLDTYSKKKRFSIMIRREDLGDIKKKKRLKKTKTALGIKIAPEKPKTSSKKLGGFSFKVKKSLNQSHSSSDS
mmetsp:Transcript_38264/g.58339  ORF Transcript_38264/g.58339 Transcript_38264/m.58339 type:complete len:96 (+) Transcript_38264:1132-1419(+)